MRKSHIEPLDHLGDPLRLLSGEQLGRSRHRIPKLMFE
jgi:hypothetical protein